jgi:hypothetical protein
MAVQEALERLECLDGHTDENEQSHSSPQDQLVLLIEVYASGMPSSSRSALCYTRLNCSNTASKASTEICVKYFAVTDS